MHEYYNDGRAFFIMRFKTDGVKRYINQQKFKISLYIDTSEQSK